LSSFVSPFLTAQDQYYKNREVGYHKHMTDRMQLSNFVIHFLTTLDQYYKNREVGNMNTMT
jgi:hypothetical protein